MENLAARCWARVVGVLVAAVGTVGAAGVAVALSNAGWHEVVVTGLLMVAAVGAVLLVAGNLVLARTGAARARSLLSSGTASSAVVVLGLVLAGTLALVVVDDGADAAFVTWVAAAPAGMQALLGLLGGQDARSLTAGPRPGG